MLRKPASGPSVMCPIEIYARLETPGVWRLFQNGLRKSHCRHGYIIYHEVVDFRQGCESQSVQTSVDGVVLSAGCKHMTCFLIPSSW